MGWIKKYLHLLSCSPSRPPHLGEEWVCPECGTRFVGEHVPDIIMTTEMLPLDCGGTEWVRRT